MWDVMPQPGLASTVLDFTNDLLPLIVGLMGLVLLSVGVLVFLAVRHYLSQKAEYAAKLVYGPVDHRDAA